MSKYVKFLHANFAISTVVVVEQMAELLLPLPVNLVLQFYRKKHFITVNYQKDKDWKREAGRFPFNKLFKFLKAKWQSSCNKMWQSDESNKQFNA